MKTQNNINCIILCGGKGARMQSREKHKVCFEINGKPAIYHGMDNYLKAGLHRSSTAWAGGRRSGPNPASALVSTQEICYDYWGSGVICDNCIS